MSEESPCKRCPKWVHSKPCKESMDCPKRLAYVDEFGSQSTPMDRPVRTGPKPNAPPKRKRGRPRIKRPPGKYVNVFIDAEIHKIIKDYCKKKQITQGDFIVQAALEKIKEDI